MKATRDEALTSLLVGVPTLSVSNDNRRQVFTEAEDDVHCYQGLFTILRPKIYTPMSLVFMPSGSTGNSSRHEVLQAVALLRENGVRIHGIIDRDVGAEGVPAGVKFTPGRYSLENLILDPVAVGIMLVRKRRLLPQRFSERTYRFMSSASSMLNMLATSSLTVYEAR